MIETYTYMHQQGKYKGYMHRVYTHEATGGMMSVA